MIRGKNLKIISLLAFLLFSAFSLHPFFKYHPENKDEFIKIFRANFNGFQYYSEFVGEPTIIISPHATYQYSGKVAAKTFNLIKGDYKLIIILGPPHYQYFRGFAVYSGEYLKSPLGIIKTDSDEVLKIKKSIFTVFLNKELFYEEHSINIQLPYIQETFKDVKILPIIIGDTKKDELKLLAKYLIKLLKRKKALLLISTDLSHYHKLNVAKEIDENTIKVLENKKPDTFLRLKQFDKVEACGWRALYVGMYMAKKMKLEFFPVSRGYSSDFDGNKERVVGYFSGLYYKKKKLKIHKDEKEEIFKIVKNTILKKKDKVLISSENSIFNRRFGVFITLKKNGKLRGCMGNIISNTPLYKTLKRISVLSAFEDPRFEPLKSDKIKNLEINVSLIFNLRKLYNIKNLKLGEDGLLIIKGEKRGVLLPEIPALFRWDRKEFLENCCLKADLQKKCWKNKKTKIYIFNSKVLSFFLK